MMWTKRIGIIGLVAGLAACSDVAPPDVPFLAYGDNYDSKPDLARVEHELPLGPDELMKLTPENVAQLSQEQIDQIYARLTAGPIPDGAYNGGFFFADGGGARRISELMGGVKGLAVRFKLDSLETIGEMLWKGKVFYRDQRLLRNMIQDRQLLKLIVDDPDGLPKTDIPGRKILGLIQDDAWLLFPAKLYCGQSLLDSRRESVIIDYAFNDEIDGYRERPDFLAGRRGLRIRDEIRMVRPGFYLGRAYMGHVFLLNFTLYNKDVADADTPAFVETGAVAEDCWPGSQAPARLAQRGQ